MIELLSQPDAWLSLAVLTAMEIVLGIDNIVFITILAGRLPTAQQPGMRRAGLMIALMSRLLLLLGIAWVARLTDPLFELVRPWSGKDLILLAGGLFLLWKATTEIYQSVEHPEMPGGPPEGEVRAGQVPSRARLLAQIALLDLVFSLDSVITAVGMVDHVPIMVVAMVIAVVIMMVFANPVGDFVQSHPSVRILALSFLVLIGVMLLVEGTGGHVAKGYLYVAMLFALLVELLNLRRSAKLRRDAGRGGPTDANGRSDAGEDDA